MPRVPLQSLVADPAVHGRARVRHGAVRKYRQAMREAGETLPPVEAFRDRSGRLWLADGFLRYYAAQAEAAGSGAPAEIEVQVHEGELRDAIRFACGANARHGLPASREDKRQSVAALLLEFRTHSCLWQEFAGENESDAEIARLCQVSRGLVAELRPHCTDPEAYGNYNSARWLFQLRVRAAKAEARKAAAAEAEQAAKSAPPPPARPDPAALDDPTLAPRERAQAALARAAAAAAGAKRAMSAARKAYPEANHYPAVLAVVQAEAHLADLTDGELPREMTNHDALKVIEEMGVKVDSRTGQVDDRRGFARRDELPLGRKAKAHADAQAHGKGSPDPLDTLLGRVPRSPILDALQPETFHPASGGHGPADSGPRRAARPPPR